MHGAFVRTGAVAALAALGIMACAGPGSEAEFNLSGFPPAFQHGYAQGCESAGMRRTRRDEGRYRTDEEYMQGWNDGYSVCQRR